MNVRGRLAATGAIAATAIALSGCGGGDDATGSSAGGSTSTSTTSGSGGAGPGSGGAGGGAVVETGRSLFEATVQQGLEGQCAVCHVPEGAADKPFMIEPPGDLYAHITAWPNFVVRTPSTSTLVTRPSDEAHASGQVLLEGNLKDAILAWLEVEAKLIPEPASEGPAIEPVKPIIGADAETKIFLGDVDPNLADSWVSFKALEVGDPPTILRVFDLALNLAGGVDAHVVHPLFTVYPEGDDPRPDPVDSFSTLDVTYPEDGGPQLGTGEVLLTNWQRGARIGLAFERVEVTVQGGGSGPPANLEPCVDLEKFKTLVVPEMSKTCQALCHGGTKAAAMNTMNLASLLDDEPSAACEQVRARITPGDPAASRILVVTDPKKPVVHEFKFGGKLGAYDQFRAAVTPWILAEGGSP